ncbi:regulator of volume decrease after cellular swelling-domain-containing protein [Cunninghamella echinulata]|nr:regulator of volume decrease after cellular swelling-domain-containing protein [Cunninghamella echinulata]
MTITLLTTAPDLSGLVIRHSQNDVVLRVSPPLQGTQDQITGKLYICESLLYFYSDVANAGIAVEYPDIIIHAISRQNGEPSIYCQLDADLFFPNQQLPEDTEDIVTELNFSPKDSESLEDIYLALSDCAALHPDQEFMAEQNESEGEEDQYYTNPSDETELNEVQQAALRHLESVFEQPKQNGTDHANSQFENAMEDD